MIIWDNSDYLMHYGTKGHSGRYPPGSGKNPKTGSRSILLRTRKTTALKELKEKGLVPKNATGQNVEKWGNSPDTNTLYLTGSFGTGKTTIANKLKDKNTDVIHLDKYFGQGIGDENKNFSRWLDNNKSDYKNLRLGINEIPMDDWRKSVQRFTKSIENYSRYAYKNNRKVIVEGVQILDNEDVFTDSNYFNNKPLILLNTNSITAVTRANKRDNRKFAISDVQDVMTYRKEIKQLKKNNSLRHSIKWDRSIYYR